MTASPIIQLTSTGVQDTYLTDTPQINVFKYRYFKYVNFATETYRINPDVHLDFGGRGMFTIPRRGHLLSNLFLRIKVPRLVLETGTYLSWCETLGYAIIDDNGVDLEIGGLAVDTFYPRFWDIYDSFEKPDNDLGANLMLMKSDIYVSSKYNAQKDYELVIPLKFWFTRSYNVSLPVVAMPNQNIRIKFNLRKFQDCINYDGVAPPDYSILESEIIAEYIYLDDKILPVFNSDKHQFLIEQVRYNGVDPIIENSGLRSTKLHFNNPCKELLFACVTKDNILNNNYFNYSYTDESPLVKEIGLVLDGTTRFDPMPEVFHRLVYASVLHNSVPLKYVYTIPFCTKPQDNQPTGTLNMSRFDDVNLQLKMITSNPKCFVYVFAQMYNIITIENGLLVFKFQY